MVACFATMDTLVKFTGTFMPVLCILWARYAFQAASMAVWLGISRRRLGGAGFRSAHPRFQAVRGGLLVATSATSFFGVQFLPVAEFTAINMLTPVGVTLLAAWFLNEPVSRLRWALVCGGFAGALVVIRPGSGLYGWAVVFPLAGAFSYAAFQVLTSKLSALERPLTTHFYTGLAGVAVVTPLLLASGIDVPALWAGTAPRHLALLVLIGFLGTTGHLLLIVALGLAPTSTLMPFVYLQIAMAAFVGWLMFGHVPDGWAWAGMGVVAACGAASAWLNVREAAARRAPESVVAADTMAD